MDNLKKRIFAASIPLLLLWLCSACVTDKNEEKNVILITLDTQRADYIGAYGRNLAETPNIDMVAAEGILVENCYSPIPITLPAHLSLFYSRIPHELGVYNNGEKFIQNERISLAEIFKQKEYNTAAFVSLGVLKKNIGVQEGFINYTDDFMQNRWYLTAEEINARAIPWIQTHAASPFFVWIHYSDPHDPYAPPDMEPDLHISLNNELAGSYCLQKNEVEELRLDLKKGGNTLQLRIEAAGLEIQEAYPARFVRFELESPEDPSAFELEFLGDWKKEDNGKPMVYMPESGGLSITSSRDDLPIIFRFQGKLNLRPEENRLLYRKEVEYLDRQLGLLFHELEKQGLWERSHVVIVGDHGEGLGEYLSDKERPQYGHLHYLYAPYVRVPLIFHSPGHPGNGSSISKRSTLMDVAPTILGLMGWKTPKGMMGRDLFKVSMPEKQDVFLETFLPQAYYDRISMIRDSWHLILTPQIQKYELYDLDKEELEKTDLYETFSGNPEIKAMVKELNALTRKILAQKAQQVQESDAQEILKSLGYIK